MSKPNQKRLLYRHVLSLKTRAQIVKAYRSDYPRPMIESLANKYSLSVEQIRKILSNQDEILQMYEEDCEKIKNVLCDTRSIAAAKTAKLDGMLNPLQVIQYDSATKSLGITKLFQIVKEQLLGNPKPKIGDIAAKFQVSEQQIRKALSSKLAIITAYEDEFRRKSQQQSATPEDEDNIRLELKNIKHLKIIHDYYYEFPTPKLSYLAEKYDMSARNITQVLLNHEAAPVATNKVAKQQAKKDRTNYMEFLDSVMYEYLQRALYHSVPLDDAIVQIKAKEVKEFIPFKIYQTTNKWLSNFKRKFGLDNLSLKGLRARITITEEKESSLDAVDLVQFVREQNQTTANTSSVRKSRNGTEAKKYKNANDGKTKVDVTAKQLAEYRVAAYGNEQTDLAETSTVLTTNQECCLDSSNLPENESSIVAIKNEPLSFEETTKQSAQITDEMTQEIDLNPTTTSSLEEEVIIKIEPASLDMDEDIKPTITFAANEESNQLIHTNPFLPEAIDEDVKPTIVSNTFAIKTEQLLGSSDVARPSCSQSSQPVIETPEDAIKLVEILENYALTKENYKAIGLLAHLEEAFLEPQST